MKKKLIDFIADHTVANSEICIRLRDSDEYNKYVCSDVPDELLEFFVINFFYLPTGLYLTLNDRFYSVD